MARKTLHYVLLPLWFVWFLATCALQREFDKESVQTIQHKRSAGLNDREACRL